MGLKELCPEEKALSYSKYYYKPLEPPDPVALQIWNAGPIDPSTALPLENINDLFKPGYLPTELGYCKMPDGVGFIANYVRMHNVTEDMVDWWFVWHFITPPSVPKGNGNLRYKIWNPREHLDTGASTEEGNLKRLDSSLHYRLRNRYTDDFIIESFVGGKVLSIKANAVPLEQLGADIDIINSPGFGTSVSASCEVEGGPCGVNVHYFRPVPGGLELRSRYWYGYRIIDGKLIRDKKFPDPSIEFLRDGCMHNMVEYPHLGRLLPDLYREESWKSIGAY